MNRSAIFTAAHATARTLTTGTYRARFAQGLKAAYAAAKAPAAPAVHLIVLSGQKAVQPATYKQFAAIMDLDEVLSVAGLNGTKFSQYVNSWEASEAITFARAGQQVKFAFA